MIPKLKMVIKRILFALKIIDSEKYQARIQKLEDHHPERLAVLPYCKNGRGIDVGCGQRKTNANCIGVDIVPPGEMGTVGSAAYHRSQADICASGDMLPMFADEELDFVIARHNLEHYIDLVKTLKEWRRVLKMDGCMAIVLPDEEGLNKVGKRGVALDPTHEHAFTQESFKNLIEVIGGLEMIRLEPVIPNWSFIGVCKKIKTAG